MRYEFLVYDKYVKFGHEREKFTNLYGVARTRLVKDRADGACKGVTKQRRGCGDASGLVAPYETER